MTRLDDVTHAAWFEPVAAEARQASRRYWAEGGPADRGHPAAADIERIWPLGGRSENAPTRNEKAWITRQERG